MKYMDAAKKLKNRSGYLRKASWAPDKKIVVKDGSVVSGDIQVLSGGTLLEEDFVAYDPDGNVL